MKIIIEAEPKEVAALVLAVQERLPTNPGNSVADENAISPLDSMIQVVRQAIDDTQKEASLS